jgi:hypothetical protein
MVKTNNITFNLGGSGIAYDKFHRVNEVSLPVFGDYTLDIPPFFMIKKKNGWKLVNPLTEMRTLATRNGKYKSIQIRRKNVEEPDFQHNYIQDFPVLSQFTKKDQATIKKYYQSVKDKDETEYQTKNKPRGFPATLYKNAERAGYRETSKKVYTKNVKAPPKPKSTKPVGRPRRPRRTITVVEDIAGDGLFKNESEDEESDSDKEEGEGLLGEIGKKAYEFGKHLVYGRYDAYPPSAKKVLDANESSVILSVELHRMALPSLYTKLMSWATSGETDRRLAQQPKDTLFHISMWVKLTNGKTILVEKNEVINLQVNPTKKKEEEVQQVSKPPPHLTFGDLLEKTRKAVGDNKFFTYSAKNNNCGNFIEFILKTNGMNSEATHKFIGQDTKAIMEGFPSLRKFINTLTDTAGRANVLLEGGSILEEIKSPVNNIMPIQGGRILPQVGHPALASDLFPRIPQAYTQVHLTHPYPIHHSGGKLGILGFGMPHHSPLGSDPRTYTPRGGKLGMPEPICHLPHMAKGLGLEPPSRSPITDPSLLGNGLGSGMKKPKFVKGSKEAKEYMASIRKMKH